MPFTPSFTDVVAYEKEKGKVISLLVSQPFAFKITLVNLLTNTLYHIPTCLLQTKLQPHEVPGFQCFKPRYMTVTSDSSVLVTTEHGVLLLRNDSWQIEPLIHPDNFWRHEELLADGDLTTAKTSIPRRLVAVPGYESVFIFIDLFSASIRVIDLAAQSVYTLCLGVSKNRYLRYQENITRCNLLNPYSLLLLESTNNTHHIIVGTDHMLLEAEINIAGMSWLYGTSFHICIVKT